MDRLEQRVLWQSLQNNVQNGVRPQPQVDCVLNFLPYIKMVDWFILKAFVDIKLNMVKIMGIVFYPLPDDKF